IHVSYFDFQCGLFLGYLFLGCFGSTLDNKAVVGTASGADANPGNDSSDAFTTVTEPEADWQTVKTHEPSVVRPGGYITYTITATNNGPSWSNGPVISDLIPPSTTLVDHSCPAGWSFSQDNPLPGVERCLRLPLLTASPLAIAPAGTSYVETLVV